jgi:hypothetical protein
MLDYTAFREILTRITPAYMEYLENEGEANYKGSLP